MPKFNIIIQRTREETCEINMTAENEDAAQVKAEKLMNAEGFASEQEWELEDEFFELYAVNEE